MFSKKKCEENTVALVNADLSISLEKGEIHVAVEKTNWMNGCTLIPVLDQSCFASLRTNLRPRYQSGKHLYVGFVCLGREYVLLNYIDCAESVGLFLEEVHIGRIRS